MANVVADDPGAMDPSKQRDRCNHCDIKFDPLVHESAVVPSNLKVHADRKFTVWRCPSCSSLHCLDVVDLDYYYSLYPKFPSEINYVSRVLYRNEASQLQGMQKHHKLLDYGCNTGSFVRYLHQSGHTNAWGYDPYSSEFGDKAVLEHGPFDYILLQDVLEHVVSPIDLLRTLDDHLKPGGRILISGPNAECIDLGKWQTYVEHWNGLHTPYHLHIPTPGVVESLGGKLGWKRVAFFDRTYHDTVWPGVNMAAISYYQKLKGSYLEDLFEPIDLRTALFSLTFWFYALFGYWFCQYTGFAMLLEKPVTEKKNL